MICEQTSWRFNNNLGTSSQLHCCCLLYIYIYMYINNSSDWLLAFTISVSPSRVRCFLTLSAVGRPRRPTTVRCTYVVPGICFPTFNSSSTAVRMNRGSRTWNNLRSVLTCVISNIGLTLWWTPKKIGVNVSRSTASTTQNPTGTYLCIRNSLSVLKLGKGAVTTTCSSGGPQ